MTTDVDTTSDTTPPNIYAGVCDAHPIEVRRENRFGAWETSRLGDVCPHQGRGAIEIEVLRYVIGDDGARTGYVRRHHNRTMGEVADALAAALDGEGLVDEHFGVYAGWKHAHGGYANWREHEFPAGWHRIACSAVTGGSEGHYVHVELVYRGAGARDREQTDLVFLGKTFRGMAHAYALAQRCAELLGA